MYPFQIGRPMWTYQLHSNSHPNYSECSYYMFQCLSYYRCKYLITLSWKYHKPMKYIYLQISIMQDPLRFLSHFQFAIIMALQIYLPCYYANEVTINSNLLTNHVYNSNWLDSSVSRRRDLILFMEFVKRPVKFTAGSFFEVGLPIFSKVLDIKMF